MVPVNATTYFTYLLYAFSYTVITSIGMAAVPNSEVVARLVQFNVKLRYFFDYGYLKMCNFGYDFLYVLSKTNNVRVV